MKYEHIPRPDIEQHYHIRELIEGQEKRSADRTFHQNRIKDLAERENLIKDAKLICITDFWCEECQEDFKGVAIKEVEQDWSNFNQRVAHYKTKCFKGHWCKRMVTDKFMDTFWFRSKAVANDRSKHSLDTIQPHETGFNLLYGHANKQ